MSATLAPNAAAHADFSLPFFDALPPCPLRHDIAFFLLSYFALPAAFAADAPRFLLSLIDAAMLLRLMPLIDAI